MVTICTYNARALASESTIEDLLMQARMIRYDVIGLAETRGRNPFYAVYDTGEELFLETYDSTGVGVLVNKGLSMNIDSFEQLTIRIGPLRSMWINTVYDNLLRLRADLKQLRKEVEEVYKSISLYGL
uniref:Endo/exonuclease/phosphatase domain-containing protein n=1 Tax=Angiostrongylus cantonensis TaxID=6313 RepID=A0A0K0D450_ANGCA